MTNQTRETEKTVGGLYVLSSADIAGWPAPLITMDPMPALRAGDVLLQDGVPVMQAEACIRPPAGPMLETAWLVRRLEAEIDPDNMVFEVATPGLTLAWVTLSDKGSQGKRQDESGPLIEQMCADAFELGFARGFVIPDDRNRLKALLADLCLTQGFDLVLTTGGTGVGPRDITPEATLDIIEKRLPGFERAMTATSLAKTPHAVISRAVAGTLGESVILNMPGSPKAVRETLEAVLPALPHCVEKLRGDQSDCARLHP